MNLKELICQYSANQEEPLETVELAEKEGNLVYEDPTLGKLIVGKEGRVVLQYYNERRIYVDYMRKTSWGHMQIYTEKILEPGDPNVMYYLGNNDRIRIMGDGKRLEISFRRE